MRHVTLALLSLALVPTLLTGCSLFRHAPEQAVTAPVCIPAPLPATTPETKPAPVTAVYTAADWKDLPGWPGEQLQASWPAWLKSCEKLSRRSDWQAICSTAASVSPQDNAGIQAFFELHFSPWQIASSTGSDTGLITGYYEALLTGSLTQKPGSVPLYGVPPDMLTLELGSVYPDLKGLRLRGRLVGNKVLPYWSREDIERDSTPVKGEVLAWADDAVDAFFLQVQGSGRIQLEDGSLLRLGYADQNGHPYRSIGKWLVDNGELTLEQASMQSIRAWAQANPQRLQEMLNANPSYVFFRTMPDNNTGAIGALNVPLTDAASIAVDPKFTPLGSPVYLATTRPDTGAVMNRLVQAQDTGGAIRGPVRADFFWGFGHDAAALAGKMKQQGQMWLLWPKELALPGADKN